MSSSSIEEFSENENTRLLDREVQIRNIMVFGQNGEQVGNHVSFVDKFRAWRFDPFPFAMMLLFVVLTVAGAFAASVWLHVVALAIFTMVFAFLVLRPDHLKCYIMLQNLPVPVAFFATTAVLCTSFSYIVLAEVGRVDLFSSSIKDAKFNGIDGEVVQLFIGDIGLSFVFLVFVALGFSWYLHAENDHDGSLKEVVSDDGVKSLMTSHAEADDEALRDSVEVKLKALRKQIEEPLARRPGRKDYAMWACLAPFLVVSLWVKIIRGNVVFVGPLDVAVVIAGSVGIMSYVAVILNYMDFTLGKLYGSCYTLVNILSDELLQLEATATGEELLEWMALREVVLRTDCVHVYTFCSYPVLGLTVSSVYISLMILLPLFRADNPQKVFVENDNNVQNFFVAFLFCMFVLIRLLRATLKIWTEQSRHIKLLHALKFANLYGTANSGKLCQSEDEVEAADVPFESRRMGSLWARRLVIEDIIFRIKEYDDGPLVLGIPLKPTVIRIVVGYLVSALLAMLTQLYRTAE